MRPCSFNLKLVHSPGLTIAAVFLKIRERRSSPSTREISRHLKAMSGPCRRGLALSVPDKNQDRINSMTYEATHQTKPRIPSQNVCGNVSLVLSMTSYFSIVRHSQGPTGTLSL